MVGGLSASWGVLLYDTAKQGDTGILCYYEGDTPKYKTGDYKALSKELTDTDDQYVREPRGALGMIILGLLILMVGCVVLTVKLVGGFFPILGSVLFAVISFLPLLTVIYSTVRLYPDDGDFHRFRRYHAAEHMAINFAGKFKKEMKLEDYRKCTRFHGECGTVLNGTIAVFAGILGYAVASIPAVGFGQACLTVLIGLGILILNYINPLNPLKLCQVFVVEKPTDRELTLVLEGLKWVRADFWETIK